MIRKMSRKAELIPDRIRIQSRFRKVRTNTNRILLTFQVQFFILRQKLTLNIVHFLQIFEPPFGFPHIEGGQSGN